MGYDTTNPSKARPLTEVVAEKTSSFADKASAKVEEAVEAAEATAVAAAETGRQAAHSVQQVAGNMQGAVNRSLKDQPMATLGIAAVMGFVLGALWKT